MEVPVIVENWTRTYEPMKHDPGKNNQRFFFTDSYMGLVDFTREITDSLTPCVVMESNREGYITPGFVTYNYAIYFMVRATDMADGGAAAVAKMAAELHMRAFYSYLVKQRKEGQQDYRGLYLDDGLDFQSIGPLQNGWYAVLLQLKDKRQINLCV